MKGITGIRFFDSFLIYIPQVKGLAIKIGIQMGVLVNDKIELETRMVAVPNDWSDYGEFSIVPYESSVKDVFTNVTMTDVCNSIDFGIPFSLVMSIDTLMDWEQSAHERGHRVAAGSCRE